MVSLGDVMKREQNGAAVLVVMCMMGCSVQRKKLLTAVFSAVSIADSPADMINESKSHSTCKCFQSTDQSITDQLLN